MNSVNISNKQCNKPKIMKSKNFLSSYFLFIVVIICFSTLATMMFLFQNEEKSVDIYENYFLKSNAKLVGFRKIVASKKNGSSPEQELSFAQPQIKTISCNLPTYKNSKCLVKENNVFVPFDFMRKKFDVQGKIEENGRFSVAFSYGKIYMPQEEYNSSGQFLWFAETEVEPRERVKHINLEHGVPVSSQWLASGHIYPIQVGQFGLSHFSNWIKNSNQSRSMHRRLRHFTVDEKNKFIHHNNQNALVKPTQNGFEFHFSEKAIYKTNYSFDMRYLLGEISTNNQFKMSIDLMLRDAALAAGNYIVRLTYSFNKSNSGGEEKIDKFLNPDQTYQVNYYLLNEKLNASFKLVRNICLDACKALGLRCENCVKPLNELLIVSDESGSKSFTSLYFKVYQISLIGQGRIENSLFREQSDAPDFEFAKLAADYLVKSQNRTNGGWKVGVVRSFGKGSKFWLRPNWFSAMAQAHAISLLCRVYSHTRHDKYLKSASKALDVFFIKSEHGGVSANFMNSSLVWYEEYPTEPTSLFVLNGFIYSLFGLHDYVQACFNENIYDTSVNKAKTLFENGLESLFKLINFFDTGSRSFYDLRHFGDASVNPNLARWDYHMLHISQLYHLVNLLDADKEKHAKYAPTFKTVAKRWMEYTKGKWNENTQIKNF